MELLLQLARHHRWVTRLCGCVVRVRFLGSSIGVTIGRAVGVAVHLVTVHTVHTVHRAVGTVRGSVDPVGVTIWRGGVAVGVSSAVGTVHTVGLVRVAVGADSALNAQERRGDAGGLATRWKQVVVDIFDEDSLSL